MRIRIALVTAVTLVVGFAVASLTGNRALGGAVLVVGGVLCGWWMFRTAGWLATALTLIVVIVLFIASHPLGLVIGAWPAVLSVAAAAAAGALAYRLGSPRHTPATPPD